MDWSSVTVALASDQDYSDFPNWKSCVSCLLSAGKKQIGHSDFPLQSVMLHAMKTLNALLMLKQT